MCKCLICVSKISDISRYFPTLAKTENIMADYKEDGQASMTLGESSACQFSTQSANAWPSYSDWSIWLGPFHVYPHFTRVMGWISELLDPNWTKLGSVAQNKMSIRLYTEMKRWNVLIAIGSRRHGQGEGASAPPEMLWSVLCINSDSKRCKMLSKVSVDKLFMHYFLNMSASGTLPQTFTGALPGPRWETSVPSPLICPHLKKSCERLWAQIGRWNAKFKIS